MRKLLAGLFVSGLCIGYGVYLNLENNLSTPVVETVKTDVSKQDSKVSKHEDIDKPVAIEKSKEESLKDDKKSEDTKSTSESSKQTKSESKASTKASVSSEGKQKASNKSTSSGTKSEVKRFTNNLAKTETKTNTNSSNTSKKEETKPVEKPSTPISDPVVEPAPTAEPTKPSYACPGGVNQDVACDVILDSNFYYATYSSMAEADAAGLYYMNDVMYIGETEITNYSVQPVYRNDHSIAYYGLNLWSNGSLIQ